MPTRPAPTRIAPASMPRRRLALALSSLAWLLAGSASADDFPARLAAQARAGEQFQAVLQNAASARQSPPLDSPQAMQLLRTITDRRGLLQQPVQGIEGVTQQMGICAVAQKTMFQLLLFDIPDQPGAGQSQAELAAQVRRQADANSVRFQRQQQLIFPFVSHCLARVFPALADLAASSAPRDQSALERGLAQVRDGARMTYLGGLDVVEDPRYDPAFKQAVLSALSEDATVYARAMPVAQRHALAEQARRSVLRNDAISRPALEKIATAFDDGTCTGLCTL